MDELWKHHAKAKKPLAKDHVLYDSIYVKWWEWWKYSKIVATVPQFCHYTQCHWTVPLKQVNCTECERYPYKTV